ncbi:T9SS sorting signal type C domain-containing protein [Flavobacterium luteum]|uniref:T9SS type A sorting domain-containing protein n=1 Tax=Flavobacterium luteum TaxID=2026654 RepID=A0A7J5AHX1_9FLAO|nr:T9SS sorting signal type C domain-containing protein [Flavobacterium luteum]KAB1156599.1 T9SS type A sorting domain-containing protein [Flavobacterium luteum]
MKKLISYIFLLFASQTIISQLYVSPNSYMYVADNYVYVNQDVNIQNTGNIYFRNESQFLQGTTGVSTNQGTGKLSVFQEGTENNYAYNYWCSPIGDLAGPGNGLFGVSMLNRPTDLTASAPATLIPTLDGLATDTSLSIASRWVFNFLSKNSYSGWVQVGSASTIQAGVGFTMKGIGGSDNTTVLDGRLLSGLPSGTGIQNNPGSKQRYDFRGKPNDGNINITVGAGGLLTLTGNPYPSAINLNMFLHENSVGTGVISGAAYFWEHDPSVNSHVLVAYRGGYGVYIANGLDPILDVGTYSAATWVYYNGDGTINLSPPSANTTGGTYTRMFSPIGQGFMIDGSTLGGTAVMKNSYRVFRKEGVANNSQFHRGSKPSDFWDEIPNVAGIDYSKHSKKGLPQIKIHSIVNNDFVKQMVLAFNPNATDGYDIGKDAKSADKNLASDTYFPLDNKNEYVISTLPFDVEKRIPFAVKCKARTSFKFMVGSLLNFDLTDEIYVYDKVTGLYHDIKNGYYEVTLDSGSEDRFEITFKNASLSTEDLSNIKSCMVFQDNDSELLTIDNPKLLDLKTCSIYDISGKLIFNTKQLGSNNRYAFTSSSFSDGVYVVKLNTKDNLVITKKIIISKK